MHGVVIIQSSVAIILCEMTAMHTVTYMYMPCSRAYMYLLTDN